MIERLSGRVALLLVVIASMLVVLLGWFVLMSPEHAKADKLDSEISDTNSQLAAVTNLLDGPAGRESLISARLFDKAIPSEPRTSQILRQLSAAASRSGVELDSVTPSTAVAGTGSETIPMSVTVKGRYFGLRAFLAALRKEADLRGSQLKATGRLYSVDSIQFTGGQTTAQPGQSPLPIQAVIALNAYVYSPGSVAAAPATGATTDTTASASGTTP